jgi:hypothetical protein
VEVENAFIKKQLECEEIGILVDPNGWLTASKYKKLDRFTNEELIEKKSKAQALIRSCIFFNFYDQIRVGIDSHVFIERCHLSESRNISVNAINPRALKVIGSNFSKPAKHGLQCEWLPKSSKTEKCRNLIV